MNILSASQTLRDCNHRLRVLNISETDLPGHTLSPQWYNGQYAIIKLIFTRIAIAVIEPLAFNVAAFRELYLLEIHNVLHIIAYDSNIFFGLPKLRILQVTETTIAPSKMPANALRLLHQRLEIFAYAGDIGRGPVLTNLFGGVRMIFLHSIGINCLDNPCLNTIAAANFTGLIAIRLLKIYKCGIESIEAGAFDQIADTLMQLYLHANPLLQLHLEAFRFYLDQWPIDVWSMPKALILYGANSPYNCTIELYWLRNATVISLHYDAEFVESMICMNDVHDLNVRARKQRQFVHPARWHLNHSWISKYAFPKRQMTFNVANRSLHVTQAMPDNYRLLMWPINDVATIQHSDCPTPMWIKSNVDCQRRHHSVETIEIAELKTERFVTACVIHISMRKESLPMHCITIHCHDGFVFNWLYYGIGMVIDFLIMVIIIIIIFSRRRTIENTSNINSS